MESAGNMLLRSNRYPIGNSKAIDWLQESGNVITVESELSEDKLKGKPAGLLGTGAGGLVKG